MKFNANEIDVNWVEAKYVEEYVAPADPYESRSTECTVKDGKCTLYFPVWGYIRDGEGKNIPCVKIELPVKNGPMDGKRVGDDLDVTTLGLVKLDKNTWKIDPVVVTPVFKAYVIITGVPDTAPWQLQVKMVDNIIERAF